MKTLIPILALLGVSCFVYGQSSDKKSAVIGAMVTKPNAILVLSPPNGDQGFLLPQLTTSQRQSITPSSPDEDGLIVFDTTDKSFYYWKSNAWVKGLGADAAAAPTLAYDASTQKLSLSTGGEVSLSTLKEIPPVASNSGKFLTTDGTTLSWATVAALGDITNIIAGAGLTGGAASGDATLSVNTDGTTIAVNGSNQLELKNSAVTTGKLAAGAVTSAQLAADAVGTTALQAGAVTNGKIAQNAVSPGNLVSGGNNKILTTDATGVVAWADQPVIPGDDQTLSFSGNTLAINRGNSVSLAASGQVAGALNNLTVQNDVITSAQLANDAVGAAELANGAVDAAAIQSGVVGTTHLVSGGNSKVLTTDATGVVGWADRTSFTDAQNLSLSSNILNIDNGTSANLNALTASGQVAGALNNLVVQNDVITSAQLANDAVGSAELANGAVDANAIQNGVVGTAHLTSGGNNKVLTTDGTGIVTWVDRTSFNDDNQNLSLAGNTLNIDNGASADLSALNATGQVAGPLNNLVVQNDVITSAQLANDAVGAAELANGAVDAAAIQNDVITSAQLANDAVGAAELANGAVDAAAIQNGVVGTTHLVSGGNSKVLTTDATGIVGWADRTSFTDAQNLSLAGNTLNIDNGTSANMNALTASGQVAGALNNLVVQNDVITSAQLANDAVGVAELANGAVDAAAIQNGVVGTAHLVSGGNSKVMTTDATGAVVWADRTSFTDDNQNLSLSGNTLNIDNGTSADLSTLNAAGQVAGPLSNLVVQNDVITSAQLASDAVGAAELANGAVDAAAIQNDVVTSTQLANDAVGAAELANGSVDAAAIQSGVVGTTHLVSGGNGKVLTTDGTGVVTWADRTSFTDAQNLSLSSNTLNIDNGTSANLNALTASGQVAGALNNLVVQNDVITSAQLANDAVGAAELANGAVDAAAIQSGVVGTTHLVSGGNGKVLTTDGTGVVTWADRTSFTDAQNLSLSGNTLNIDNGASTDLNALTTSGQVAGALNNLVVQNDVITSAQLANDAVGAAELANGSVDAAAIQNGVVGTAHLVSGGNSKVLTTDGAGIVTWADRTSFTDAQNLSLTGNTLNIDNGASVNLNALTASGQVAGALNNLVVQNDVITSAQLANDAVGAAELANGSVDAAAIQNDVITAAQLANDAVGAAELANNAVDANAIQASVVNTTHLVSGGNNKVMTTDGTGVVTWADQTTLPVTGDVTGTLGATTVAKLQNRVVATTAPGSGEALTWNGSAWAPQAITVTPTTQYYAIDPANFTALEPGGNNQTILGLFQSDNTFVTAKGNDVQIMAPVNLPHNASIEGITVYYLNNDALLLGTITITLYRKSFTGANQSLATTTVGLSLVDATVNLPAVAAANKVVDNSAYSYRILVSFTDSATAPSALDAVQRIYGIRIQYTK